MNIKLLLENNILLLSLLALFSIILSYPNYITGIFTIIVVFYGSYILHYLSHYNVPILSIITTSHLKYHHSQQKNFYIDIITETLVNFFIYGMVLFYIIIVYCFPKTTILNGKIVLMYSLLYTSIHIYNYTIISSNIHRKHHIEVEQNNKICNLGPDFADKIFSTNCDEKYENSNHYIINLLLIFSSIYFYPYN